MKNILGLLLVFTLILSAQSCQSGSTDGGSKDGPPPKLAPEGMLTVNGVDLFYKKMGGGEPLIVLHGGPGLDHSYFLPQLGDLANEFQLIFYDQRLSGKSQADIDTNAISLENFIQDIEGIRTSLGLNKINLLGHSWGGFLAMHYAIKYPQNLESLILSSPVNASSSARAKEEQILAGRFTEEDVQRRTEILQSEAFQKGEASALRDLMMMSFEKQFHNIEKAKDLNLWIPDDFLARSGQFRYMGNILSNYDLHPDLEKVSCPALIIYGDQEPYARESAQALVAALPKGESEILEQAGHFPFVEQKDTYIKQVRSFLNKH